MQVGQAGTVLGLGFVLVLASTVVSQTAERLSRSELINLFPGVYTGVAKDGTEVRIQGDADGAIRGIANEKHDQGRWSVEGNRLCIQWRFWLSAKKRCGYVIRDGIWYVAVKRNGSARMRFRR